MIGSKYSGIRILTEFEVRHEMFHKADYVWDLGRFIL